MIKNQKGAKHNFKMYKFVKFYLITMSNTFAKFKVGLNFYN